MFSRRSRRSQSGFSLAEVLVATAIFAVIFIAALLVYDRSNKVFKSGVEAADMQQNTRVAFDKLVADVRLAGFDFDRDGNPTLLGEFQQPDEQIEYAGAHALTIRANLNYGTANQGRIPNLEIPNSKFPIVTTSNDEIVTYALVPDTPGATTESLTFYADVTNGTDEKRQSYPGGNSEDTVTITGVDLCSAGCNQPPYTLYRFTVDKTGSVDRTPLASNIRSLTFDYFSNMQATTALVIADPGGGQYNPATPSTLNAAGRLKRSEIKAIRVTLTGMNESNDPGWVQPGETVASVQKRRQYVLQSLIIPRNLGKRGMREQQTIPPNAPTVTAVCFNYCGLVEVKWDPPAGGGEVETYQVLYDTDTAATTWPPADNEPVGLATSYMLGGLDPTKSYRFTVAATNSYGAAYPGIGTKIVGQPRNDTTPDAPALTSVSGGTGGTTTTPEEEDGVRLTWTLPTANVAGQASCITPSGTTTGTATPQKGEMQGIEIWRSTDANFNPAAPTGDAKVIATPGAALGTYFDNTAANCVTYYYRIRLLEHCGAVAAKNVGTNYGVSTFMPPYGASTTVDYTGRASTAVAPIAPGPLVVNAASESCNGLGQCSVSMSWPAVTKNAEGDTIFVDQYTVQKVIGGTPTTRTLSLSLNPTEISQTNGVVTYTATGLKKVDGIHTFSVRAEQCAQNSTYSTSDNWPKCNFAGGETITASMSGVNAGNGTSGNPFDVEGAETLTLAITSAKLKSVTASVYNAATNAPVTGALGSFSSSLLGASSLAATWQAPADDVVYRIDYTVTDNSVTPCTSSGSVYVTESTVSCPFEVLATPSTTTTLAPASVSFLLKNNTNFQLTFIKAEVTWDESVAVGATPDNKHEATITSITVPPASGTTPLNATLTGTLDASSTVTATAPTGTAKIAANDKTSFSLKTNFTIAIGQGSNTITSMVGQPITKVRIFYKLAGDAAGDPARECDIFTK